MTAEEIVKNEANVSLNPRRSQILHLFIIDTFDFIGEENNYILKNHKSDIEELVLDNIIGNKSTTSEYKIYIETLFRIVSENFYSNLSKRKGINYLKYANGSKEKNIADSLIANKCDEALRYTFYKYGIIIEVENDNLSKSQSMESGRIVDIVQKHILEYPGRPLPPIIADRISALEKVSISVEQTLPNEAPVKWAERKKRVDLEQVSPTTFIEIVYKDYLGKGMTTGTLDKLDPTLYRKHNSLPDDEKVPVALLPDQNTAASNRPLPSAAELIEEREKKRKFERERKQRQRERAKDAGRT